MSSKSVPSSLQGKGLSNVWTAQLFTNEAPPLSSWMGFSPPFCSWCRSKFALNANPVPHGPHIHGFCMGNGPWCPARGKTSLKSGSHSSQRWVFWINRPDSRVLTGNTSAEVLCSEGASSWSTSRQQPESRQMLVKYVLASVQGSNPIRYECMTHQKRVH